LTRWGAGRAIFLITHRISTIERADQILYIDQGELIERGSHEQLMNLPDGRYRRFVDTESVLANRSGEDHRDGNV
jgi:ABC-type multidrug transport system fused ATPase/permease subunit